MLLQRYWDDPFAYLGMHAGRDGVVVRASLPQASRAYVRERNASSLHELRRVDGEGLFELRMPKRREPFDYVLAIDTPQGHFELEDPYRFGPVLGEIDTHLIAEGTHLRLWEALGAHRRTIEGVDGVAFAVWAPNARRASVVGDFNEWDGRRHPMRKRVECGVWEIFIPGVADWARYKYELERPHGGLLPLKADPLARFAEVRSANASIVYESPAWSWDDARWMAQRGARQRREAPMSIYEAHLGSWRRGEHDRFLSYRELAEQLLPYVAEMGFTHVELLPVTEYPFDGSWGYQPTGMFAPTSRYGTPDDFRFFVERAHQLDVGVILDWVPGHFPNDPYGLAFFDGTHLYEHGDPRKGFHPDWNTLIYNHGRREVSNFLLASALFWIEAFHVDALRVDAVASMLYLDYSRREGEWIPNERGGNENLEAIAFVQRLNATLRERQGDTVTIAEESTSWPLVSRPVEDGGLGFGFKWNMGWMHDTLRYFGYDPIYRRYHQRDLTFGLVYAFSENYVLPLSHDEVVHGKRSLLEKMPGDRWQRFANLRMLLALMFVHPGKKLLFMGDEFGAVREWNHDAQLEWHLLGDALHAGVQQLVRDLNALYRTYPALHQLDAEPQGFEWIDFQDAENSVLAFVRRARDPHDRLVVFILNATPVVRYAYRIGVPRAGRYREALNTDSEYYGGSNVGNQGIAHTEEVAAHGHAQSLSLALPPLGAVAFVELESAPQ
ncbi:MAG TPA: 1,4-alpha-glucan branching protein GlgB [Candidatus Baltobacteraceae bacterium]|nr:1,4-alpha-glucan branching protein GlgB [Candidatus Baltobacteraceae bacterium]